MCSSDLTIRMAADVIYEDRSDLDAPTARAVELLQNQLDRFEALLVDLLEISRFDAGAAVLDAERTDLLGLVQRTIDAAAPLALIALGMGLATYTLTAGWRESVAVSILKIAVQPLVVYVLARLFGLSPLQTQVVVLLGACPTGANVYLMARHFKTQEAAIASSMVLSTLLAALAVPLVLALTAP